MPECHFIPYTDTRIPENCITQYDEIESQWPDPEAVTIAKFQYASLSQEAHSLLDLVINCPPELEKTIWRKSRQQIALSRLSLYLQEDWGWNIKKIHSSLEEIKATLKGEEGKRRNHRNQRDFHFHRKRKISIKEISENTKD